MALTSKALYPGGQLGGTVAVLYTAPARTSALVTSAVFTNTDTQNQAVTVYLVRSGGSSGITNILIDAQTLAPNQPYVSPELPGRNLAPGDSIQAFASTGAKVNAVIDGYEIA